MKHANEEVKALMKLHGRSFHFASRLLAPVYRARAARLYAFCRYVDDLADEASDSNLAVQELEHIKVSLQNNHSEQPYVASIIALMQELSIPMSPLQSLINGVQSDLSNFYIKDEAELLRYAYQVAGTVGLMMCVILDVEKKEAWPFAIDLGIAMQLTNIARDVGEDAKKGRIYLPASWLGEISTADIINPNNRDKEVLKIAIKRILMLAQEYYQSGLNGLCYLPPAARYGILVAAAVYREIGQVVEESAYCSWDQRAVVTQSRKVTCAAHALLSYALRLESRKRIPRHNLNLHRHLYNCFGVHSGATP